MADMTEFNEQFTSLLNMTNDMAKETKGLQTGLKDLYKKFRTLEKSCKTKTKRVQKPCALSKELQKFLKVDTDTQLTRAKVMSMISDYIKEKNLQIQDDKRKFSTDNSLAKIFGVKKSHSMSFIEINKYVSPHLSKLEPSASASTSA